MNLSFSTRGWGNMSWEEMLQDELPKPKEWSWEADPPTMPNENGEYKVAMPVLGWDFMSKAMI